MATQPIPIPWPLSSAPGANPQESGGRLINVSAEPLGDANSDKQVWRRQAGLSNFIGTQLAGYRGGLQVGNVSWNFWAGPPTGIAVPVNPDGSNGTTSTVLGNKKISIARNQRTSGGAPAPNIVVVDPDNGAYDLTSGIAVSLSGPITAAQLPQPNSVCFQDSYLFFSAADGVIFATGNNNLTFNQNTFTQAQARSDVTLLRVIAYSGLLWAFTTASCEIYQDQALAPPGFPYGRLAVIDNGLLQAPAIAGWETGFADLCFVSHDFGVWRLVPNSYQPVKISPPDLDRLIEAEQRKNAALPTLHPNKGNSLQALCYIAAGKKFWAIASPDWCWEVNLNTLKWTERTSNNLGLNVRWRATSSHFAFGKWLVGDTLTGDLLFVDDQNFTEVGQPMLCRLESGPVAGFPNRLAIPRADFNLETGVGQAARALTMTITGTQTSLPAWVSTVTYPLGANVVGSDHNLYVSLIASNLNHNPTTDGGVNWQNNGPAPTFGKIQLIVNDATQVNNGDYVQVSGVQGTGEANGTWVCNQINGELIELQGANSQWQNPFTPPGLNDPPSIAVDITAPPNMQNPVVAISWSDDDGYTWGNPLVRALGFQRRAKYARVSVKNTGTSGPQARRWRVDCTDPVFFGFFGATQSTDPREY